MLYKKRNYTKYFLFFLLLIFGFYLYFPNESKNIKNKIVYLIKVKTNKDDTIIKLNKDKSNLYKLNAKINNVDLEFILDTGCSIVQISNIEFEYLKRRNIITKADYVGVSKASDANGNVNNLKIYNIKNFKIGNKTLNNVKCCVCDNNESPLLLGQNVFEQFSSVIIDYDNDLLYIK